MKTSFLFLVISAMLFIASCKKEARTEITEDNLSSTAKNAIASNEVAESEYLRSVRAATSKFHSTNQAIMAGYQPDEHCVSVPGVGGMGYHWANPSLVDPIFDPLKPEVLLYAKGPGGKLHLVALEYVVINANQPAPQFDGQAFDVGGAPVPVPHWTLHVWLYENNPSGMFAKFNPNISCP
jgi:hypothetical protein